MGNIGRFVGYLAVAAAILVGCSSAGGKDVGDGAPQYSLKAYSSGARDVDSNDNKGKVVLIDFWATWCGPCRQSMPVVQGLYDKYKSQGLEVEAVTDEPRESVAAMPGIKGYSYPIYIDAEHKANVAFGVTALPTTVLIGKSGRILFSEEGMDARALEDAIRKALAR